VALAAVATLLIGCGDDTNTNPDAAVLTDAADTMDSAAVDDAARDDGAAPDSGGSDAAVDADVPDAAVDADVPDAAVDTGVPDAAVDTGVPDAGMDAAVGDAGMDASSVADAGSDASTPVDAGPMDSGAPACTPTGNVRVTNDPAYSDDPSLVWNGTGYAVAWNDARDGNAEIYFARLDTGGTVMGSPLRVTNAASTSEGEVMVWNGGEYAIAWYDQRDGRYEIYFTRVDAAGVEIGDDIRVTNATGTSWGPALAWNGSGYGVAWWDTRDGNDELYFARLSTAGVKIGSDVRVTTGGDVQTPSIAWNGSGYGIAWGDRRTGSSEIYFARLDALGGRIGGNLLLTGGTPGIAGLAGLTWTGSEYGVGWLDTPSGMQQLFFARLDATGSVMGTVRALGQMGFSPWNLVWTGSGYGIGISSSRAGNPEIYLSRLDAAGAPAATDERVTNDPANSRAPSIAWTGSSYGVAWGDVRDGNYEIYFARLCP
jgi:hypothetical protein